MNIDAVSYDHSAVSAIAKFTNVILTASDGQHMMLLVLS